MPAPLKAPVRRISARRPRYPGALGEEQRTAREAARLGTVMREFGEARAHFAHALWNRLPVAASPTLIRNPKHNSGHRFSVRPRIVSCAFRLTFYPAGFVDTVACRTFLRGVATCRRLRQAPHLPYVLSPCSTHGGSTDP